MFRKLNWLLISVLLPKAWAAFDIDPSCANVNINNIINDAGNMYGNAAGAINASPFTTWNVNYQRLFWLLFGGTSSATIVRNFFTQAQNIALTGEDDNGITIGIRCNDAAFQQIVIDAATVTTLVQQKKASDPNFDPATTYIDKDDNDSFGTYLIDGQSGETFWENSAGILQDRFGHWSFTLNAWSTMPPTYDPRYSPPKYCQGSNNPPTSTSTQDTGRSQFMRTNVNGQWITKPEITLCVSSPVFDNANGAGGRSQTVADVIALLPGEYIGHYPTLSQCLVHEIFHMARLRDDIADRPVNNPRFGQVTAYGMLNAVFLSLADLQAGTPAINAVSRTNHDNYVYFAFAVSVTIAAQAATQTGLDFTFPDVIGVGIQVDNAGTELVNGIAPSRNPKDIRRQISAIETSLSNLGVDPTTFQTFYPALAQLIASSQIIISP